jgi:hypothetical protein
MVEREEGREIAHDILSATDNDVLDWTKFYECSVGGKKGAEFESTYFDP